MNSFIKILFGFFEFDFRNADTETCTVTESGRLEEKFIAVLAEADALSVVHPHGGFHGIGYIFQRCHAVFGEIQRNVGISSCLIQVENEKISGDDFEKLMKGELVYEKKAKPEEKAEEPVADIFADYHKDDDNGENN